MGTDLMANGVDMLKMKDFMYFSSGMTVIIVSGVAAILVILGVLQARFIKPYRNKYPYQEYKSFEEFASKKPAKPFGVPVKDDDIEQILKREIEAEDDPILTWENVAEHIPNLSAKESVILHEQAEKIKETSSDNNLEFEDLRAKLSIR